MTRVRYGARTPEALRSSSSRGEIPEVWSTGVQAVWETDPEVIAAVLPPPLQPTDRPLVRVNLSTCDIGGHPLGAGTISVACRHGDTEGYYALTMPMTTERAVIGGREVFGEPKKLADVQVVRDGERIRAFVTRHGTTYVEVRGTVGDPLPVPDPHRSTSFYYKFLPAVDGDGFDADPQLVHVLRNERTRSLHRVDGEVLLRDSDLDPVADLPVRRLVSLQLSERTSDQRGFVAATVKAEEMAPYVHQRYDDVQQIRDEPPAAPAPKEG